MEGMMVEHWQHGTGMIVRRENDVAVVLFEKDNKERTIALANLRSESGQPIVAQESVGPTPDELSPGEQALLAHIREAGKPVFTDYPSIPKLMQELNSRGANFGSAGTVSSYASKLNKRGLIRYAGGVKGSGWVAE